jgi:UDP-N-acetylmuramate dehydrogenase
MDIKENAPLSPLTTFQIGGPARYLISAQSLDDMQAGLKLAGEKALPVFILGGGSNLLVQDGGFYGVVIKIELAGVQVEEGEAPTSKVVIAEAGEGWDDLVERCVNEKLWGIENLSGIPGTVGGAVVQNIGAYGAALSEVLLWTEALDTTTGEVKRFTNAECLFGYRDSFFKHHANYIVLRAALGLSTTPAPNVSYKDLAKLFTSSSVDIDAIRKAVLEIRKGKFPDLTVEGTAGSFFKNPIVTVEEAQALEEQYPGLEVFVMPETRGVKVPLAWLLDNVLKLKGERVGGARLYEKQPLVIAAAHNTKSSDVVALVEKIKTEVKDKLHIDIEPEVKIL